MSAEERLGKYLPVNNPCLVFGFGKTEARRQTELTWPETYGVLFGGGGVEVIVCEC